MTEHTITSEFSVDEIPDEVKQDIASAYGEVDYSQYGIIDDGTKSRKTRYQKRVPLEEDTTGFFIDPSTFESQPKLFLKDDYDQVTGFIVRLNEDTIPPSIRAVSSSGTVIGPKIINETHNI